MRVLSILLFCLLLFVNIAKAQDYLTTNPSSIHWQQVQTPHFNIIFPDGMNRAAMRVANDMESVYEAESVSLQSKPEKINLVVQNQTAISNGFVSMTPRRVEFYSLPPQNYNFLGTNDWLHLLASHEYRHVVQFQKAKDRMKIFYGLLGYTGVAALSQLAGPDWFWEGDAVCTETAFTPSGRGRIPNFNLAFTSNALSNRKFNYDKQYLNSYKHFIPNHYVLGYNLTSYARAKAGNAQVWDKVLNRAWQFPLMPFAFSHAVKKETGLNLTQLYREMANEYERDYQEKIKSLTLTPFEKIYEPQNNAYTDYAYPTVLSDGSIVALKSGMGDIEKIVLLKNGREKKIVTPGLMNNTGMLSVANGRMVWDEYRFDPRWGARTYSVVMTYDTLTKVARPITEKSRYAGSAISPDGKKVATILSNNNYETFLHILDFETGKILTEIKIEGFGLMPRWDVSGRHVLLIQLTGNWKSIMRYGELGIVRRMYEGSQLKNENIGYLQPTKDYIFYNSPISGIDNIYAYHRESGKKYQVTSSRFGAYNPSIDKDETYIYYNEQTPNGLSIVRKKLTPSEWNEVNFSYHNEHVNVLTHQEHDAKLLKNDTLFVDYPIKKYSKFKHLINPYAWGLLLTQSDYLSQTPSMNVGITSQDILSTTALAAGYKYFSTDKTHLFYSSISYHGWYPVLSLQAHTGTRQTISNSFGNQYRFTWKENGMDATVTLPFNLTRSKYYQGLNLYNTISLVNTSNFKAEVNQVAKGNSRVVTFSKDTLQYVFNTLNDKNLIYNVFGLQWYHVLKKSRRDFNPAWGQVVNLYYFNTPYGGSYQGKMFAVNTQLFFPGVLKHHSFFVQFAYQDSQNKNATNIYRFRNQIYRPRGYSYPYDETFVTWRFNYKFLVFCPDMAVGPVVNIQRIKLNLFYDYGSSTGKEYYTPTKQPVRYYYVSDIGTIYKTYGGELTFDLQFFRMKYFPVELGYRLSFTQPNKFQQNTATVSEIVFTF